MCQQDKGMCGHCPFWSGLPCPRPTVLVTLQVGCVELCDTQAVLLQWGNVSFTVLISNWKNWIFGISL